MRKPAAILTLLVIVLMAPVSLSAQSGLLNRANRDFNDLAYHKAIPLYERALEKKPGNLEASINLADCYRLTNNFQQAEKWYGEVVGMKGSDPINILYYAQMLQVNKKTSEARKWFEKYRMIRPDDERGSVFEKDIIEIERLLKDSTVYTIRNLDINTANADFGPSFYKNGITFVSDREESGTRIYDWTGRPFLNIYFSKGIEGMNKDIVDFSGALNTRMHEGPMVFNEKGDEIFFTRNNLVKRKVKNDKEGTVKLKIFRAVKEDGNWSKVEELPFNSDEYSVAHPTLSPDGKALYFASDMPGGLGSTDIYVSYREGDSWGRPINLGPSINTRGYDAFPFMHEDGTLFYASDGRGGLGGLDVYRTQRNETSHLWEKPLNVGYPINSVADDFGLIWNEDMEIGYFASDRLSGKGSDDIYSVVSTGIMLRGIVYDRQTKERIGDAFVELIEDPEIKVADRNTDENGDFIFNAVSGKTYLVKASADEYIPNSELVNLAEFDSKVGFVQIPLDRVQPDLIAECNGVVVDQNGEPIAGATVTVRNSCRNTVSTVESDANGIFAFASEEGCSYTFDGSKSTYLPGTATLNAANCAANPDPALPIVTVTLTKPVEGLAIELKHIYYDFDMDYIREDAAPDLEKLVVLMNDYPDMMVEIGSHTDARGTIAYNEDLSQRRAQSVVNYLINRGILPSRLTPRGYGESQIRNQCEDGVTCSKEDHQFNRRTEFTVTYLGKAVSSEDKEQIPVNTWKPAD